MSILSFFGKSLNIIPVNITSFTVLNPVAEMSLFTILLKGGTSFDVSNEKIIITCNMNES